MRRSLVLVFLTAWLMVPSVARADHGIESARGGGRTETPGVAIGNVAFAAQDGPSGVSGTYHRVVRNEQLNQVFVFRGEVDCLAVVGNTAVMSGDIVQQTGRPDPVTLPENDRFMVIGIDNGNPEEGMTTDVLTELITFAGGPPDVTDPTTCVTTSGGGFAPFGPMTHGNVIVHDDV